MKLAPMEIFVKVAIIAWIEFYKMDLVFVKKGLRVIIKKIVLDANNAIFIKSNVF